MTCDPCAPPPPRHAAAATPPLRHATALPRHSSSSLSPSPRRLCSHSQCIPTSHTPARERAAGLEASSATGHAAALTAPRRHSTTTLHHYHRAPVRRRSPLPFALSICVRPAALCARNRSACGRAHRHRTPPPRRRPAVASSFSAAFATRVAGLSRTCDCVGAPVSVFSCQERNQHVCRLGSRSMTCATHARSLSASRSACLLRQRQLLRASSGLSWWNCVCTHWS